MNPQEEKEKAIWKQQKLIEFKQELKNNAIFLSYLEKTPPHARERFIDEYASDKVNWLDWGPQHVAWNDAEDLQWVELATKGLKEIQQKKLFDAQCLWRAEKLDIKEINIGFDFYYWEDNIFNCSFIEPINQDEVEMYLRYLLSDNYEAGHGFFFRWQNYAERKKEYNDESEMASFPEWYDFYNGQTGLSIYMEFPDIRGDKEAFYYKLWVAERVKNDKKKKVEAEAQKVEQQKAAETQAASSDAAAPQIDVDRRPHLDYFEDGWMTWFVKTFEDKQTQDIFDRYGGEERNFDFDEFLDKDLDILCKADKLIPIEAWFDWKEAVHKIADKFRREKIAEAMPFAYKQYRVSIDLNLGFEEVQPLFRMEDWGWQYEAILRGRELNGEPRDYDF